MDLVADDDVVVVVVEVSKGERAVLCSGIPNSIRMLKQMQNEMIVFVIFD